MGAAPRLFAQDTPPGFSYIGGFLTDTEEAALIDAIAQVTFSAFEMRGVIVPGWHLTMMLVLTGVPVR